MTRGMCVMRSGVSVNLHGDTGMPAVYPLSVAAWSPSEAEWLRQRPVARRAGHVHQMALPKRVCWPMAVTGACWRRITQIPAPWEIELRISPVQAP